MALLLNEGSLRTLGHLLLREQAHEVTCHVHVEWLRGIADPTWYGYLLPISGPLRVLPGQYRLRLGEHDLDVLIRRPTHTTDGVSFPFWGIGEPPALPSPDESDADQPADDDDDSTAAAGVHSA